MLGGLCPLCLLHADTTYDYTIVTVIGGGEHGITYLAEQWPTRRLVTVKVLNDPSNGEAALKGLERQRDALRKLAHPRAADTSTSGSQRITARTSSGTTSAGRPSTSTANSIKSSPQPDSDS
jgi:hypothetical protein